MDALCLQSGISGIPPPSIPITATPRANDYVPHSQVSALGRSSLFSRFSFKYSLNSIWPRPTGNANGLAVDDAVLAEPEGGEEEGHDGNWVFKIFNVKSVWRGEQRSAANDEEEIVENEEECDDGCKVDEEEEVLFDRDSFSRMLRRVSLAEARLYAHLSNLGNLAYSIPQIKKKELATAAAAATQKEETDEKDAGEISEQKNGGFKLSPFKSSNAVVDEDSVEESNGSVNGSNAINTEEASLRATTDSMTAVVSANEDVKQAFADDLNSTSSSPCEWFICDDYQSCTRFFVIQGSESFASWQANLLFEPTQFEGFDVLVHRGIYEAAKGTYQQMLPEIRAHLKSQGSRATLRFTGHSLGGSLALLVNLMLLIRNEVPMSSLLPVITFGAPSIMCGGDSLLEKLGLPRSHVQAITMHRDIVPRAFSCKYPNHFAELLKAVNGNFRCHPCLNDQKLLYAPMGELLILQPDEKFSPSHHLLPSGSGLYLLSGHQLEFNDTDKQLRAAQLVFLNSPHPLEILSDRSAYGSGGTIQRDHDMNSYLKSVRTVIRQELNQIRKVKREQRRKVWWPLVATCGSDASIVVERSMVSVNIVQDQPPFPGSIIQTGRESLKRFSRLVASQHMQLFVVLLFPARLLLLEAYNLISLR
ncbi:Fungal lipase-like domain [Sesbania bispinosa]|nr:Fungal lipase-like domain [Sesbania bispinosa]